MGTELRERKHPKLKPAETVKPGIDFVREAVPEGGPLFVHPSTLHCPGCETGLDILAFKTFETSAKYASQVLPVLKCPCCDHTFALRP